MRSGTLSPHCGYNIAGAMTAIAYGIKGPNLTVADRGDLGLSLLRRARQILLSKRAHSVFAGFTECDGIARRGSVPFGEFAYLLCLETKDRAAERGARILAEVSVQEAECAMPGAERGVVYGARARDNSLLENAETLSVSLPGLPATGDRYLSLFLIGLLSHDSELKKRFPAVAFPAGAGSTGAQVRLLCAEAE